MKKMNENELRNVNGGGMFFGLALLYAATIGGCLIVRSLR